MVPRGKRSRSEKMEPIGSRLRILSVLLAITLSIIGPHGWAGGSKGLLSIAPGETISGELAEGDDQFEDETYFDEYELEWPGGNLFIRLDSPQFDEFLIVTTPALDDLEMDRWAEDPEVVAIPNAEAGSYLLLANSTPFIPAATGPYQLCVSEVPFEPTPTVCVPEPTPEDPSPAHFSADASSTVELSWNDLGRRKVIYGDDDRRDVYEVSDPDLLEAVDSTVVLVYLEDLVYNCTGTVTLPPEVFDRVAFDSRKGFTREVCPDEPFRGQPDPGFCSGFLAGPDSVVTAGHCLRDEFECETVAFVFGFQMLDATRAVTTVPLSDVYTCAGIVDLVSNDITGEDWGVYRLDRAVTGHTPLKMRREGKIASNQDLVLLGYPLGLPAKIAGGAQVRVNDSRFLFEANLDSYSGSSGSPVLNADTLVVEGIMTRGDVDFVLDGECVRSQTCPDDGCLGEDSTRVTLFDDLAPPARLYEVYFGPPGKLNRLIGTEANRVQIGGLAANTTYEWRVDARNDCGLTQGPVWSFTTGNQAPNETDFNLTGDGRVDANDLLQLLGSGVLVDDNVFGFSDDWFSAVE